MNEAHRPLSASHKGEGPFLRRFTPFQITLHALVIVSFFGLVLTGAPLHFSYAPWSQTLMRIMGGIQVAGVIHRLCAIITFGYFFLHVGQLAYRVITMPDRKSLFWGPDSMVPQPRDVRDVIQQFKWFLGLGPRPRFDRYSYMEKFDYWAVFWGVVIIGSSGLMLWFPGFFSRFLPGWWFNIATIVHGDEALLAFGFIFTIHFFNVHLRPEKFPIDVVIFTGRATADYMKEEHPLEYERLVREGRTRGLESSRPSRAAYVWAVGLGFAALGLGVSLIALVVWAFLGSG
jgi:cytochrome b subunit of formate dehydrogenase